MGSFEDKAYRALRKIINEYERKLRDSGKWNDANQIRSAHFVKQAIVDAIVEAAVRQEIRLHVPRDKESD